ncbi:ParB/RepB/Spo0J family partition protein [Fodinicurvata sediminis]|uniref:ParB/RepB/Spo0J family partition protein n=1 Tax=Fodinicurvata sediminis TaxID=1121832 RepID=UPI0003B37BDE|nr:ParB/RepB/Spo0J family partition protein [Fodinicurvata sediminis]
MSSVEPTGGGAAAQDAPVQGADDSAAFDWPALRQRVREVMEERGWGVSALARESGLDGGRMSRFLSGQAALSLESLLALSHALDLSLLELLGMEEGAQARGQGFAELAIAHIHPNLHNPRRTFDEEQLQELAQSIASHGLLQPLVVAPRAHGDGYLLIAGERRLRALQKLKFSGNWPVDRLPQEGFAPARILSVGPEQQRAIAIIENLQRVDISPIEEARAFAALRSDSGWSTADIAEEVGKTRRYVQQRLALVERLSASAQGALEQGHLSVAQARILTQCEPARQRDLLPRILQGDLSTEAEIHAAITGTQGRPEEEPRQEQLDVEDLASGSGGERDSTAEPVEEDADGDRPDPVTAWLIDPSGYRQYPWLPPATQVLFEVFQTEAGGHPTMDAFTGGAERIGSARTNLKPQLQLRIFDDGAGSYAAVEIAMSPETGLFGQAVRLDLNGLGFMGPIRMEGAIYASPNAAFQHGARLLAQRCHVRLNLAGTKKEQRALQKILDVLAKMHIRVPAAADEETPPDPPGSSDAGAPAEGPGDQAADAQPVAYRYSAAAIDHAAHALAFHDSGIWTVWQDLTQDERDGYLERVRLVLRAVDHAEEHATS